MPAYPTHTLFSHMALRALADARHPLADVCLRHAALFRVGGIAGCDIQCMPYQVCAACGAPYRHDQQERRRCLVCNADGLEDFHFEVSDGRRPTRRDVERDLYANTHLVLYRRHRGYGVAPEARDRPGPPEQPLPRQAVEHLAFTLMDAERVAGKAGRVEEYLAFALGWFTHVVSDAIFKGLYPQSARVRFFGQQYGMAMLPAAEAITMTDIAYDFGVNWPSWHRELLQEQPDGGALRHLAMGDPPHAYGPQWTAEHGRPDPAIGRVVDALRPINRVWFHRMYTNPDYAAPTPLLDKRLVADRARWRFGRDGELDLGRLRRYAIGTGWYGAFTAGVGIYLRAVEEATRRAGHAEGGGRASPATAPAGPATALAGAGAAGPVKAEADGGAGTGKGRRAVVGWSLWGQLLGEAVGLAGQLPEEWGSRVEVRPGAAAALRVLRGGAANVEEGGDPTDYQRALARALKERLGLRHDPVADWRVVVGPPAYNAVTEGTGLLCREDVVRLKYGQGSAALVGCDVGRRVVVLAGMSDFGDHLLAEWVSKVAR